MHLTGPLQIQMYTQTVTFTAVDLVLVLGIVEWEDGYMKI